MATCPTCGQPLLFAPPEPPIGTWVRDRFGGGVTKRHANGHWAPPGCVPLASWEPMWEARGPLVVCGPWGASEVEPTREEPSP